MSNKNKKNKKNIKIGNKEYVPDLVEQFVLDNGGTIITIEMEDEGIFHLETINMEDE